MQKVSKKISTAIATIFCAELDETNKKISQFLSQQSIIKVDDDAAVKYLYNLVDSHVWRLCHKTFVYEFHQYRETLSAPADPSSSKVYDQYLHALNTDTIVYWFSKYECLEELVTNTVKNICTYLEEVFLHFREDVEELVKEGFINNGACLENVTFLDSDPHNGSRIVLCFEFSSQKKVLYKPKSLEIDWVVDQIFSTILKFDSLKGCSPVAKTITRSTYGWQLFVNRSSIDYEEIGEAYFNLGICTSLFSAFGATDMHDENVIFNGTTPYFIDLETAVQPTYFSSEFSLGAVLEEELVHSIVGTSILPAKIVTFPYKVLIGAVNTPYPQETSEMIFVWKNVGTDAIDIAKDQVKVIRETVPLKLIDETIPDPLPYQKEFNEGYTVGYRKVMENKQRIEKVLEKIECPIRVIVRPTMQYTFMLDACLFPENLISKKTMRHVLNYLKLPKLIRNVEISQDILDQEIASLMKGDIPYFSMKSNKKMLRSGLFCSKEIFDISPADHAIDRIRKMSQKKLLFDQRLIAEGYSEIRIHEAKYEKKEILGNLSPLFNDVVQRMTKDNPFPLIELIQNLSVSTKTESIETGWVGGTYGDLPISYNSAPFASFHDTGGILCLLEHLNEYTETRETPEYRHLYKQVIEGLKTLQENYYSDLELIPQSVISGNSSFEYLFEHQSNRAQRIEQNVCYKHKESKGIGDVFCGLMGEILLLSTFSDTPKNLLTNFQVDLLKFDTDLLKKVGISHGKLGQLWTLFRVAYSLDDTEQCWEIYQEIQTLSFDKSYQTTGWCNGNAGLLMILIEMSILLKEPADFHEIADKAVVLPEIDPIDLSICHGAAGVVQSLLYAYQISQDSWYLLKATDFWEKALHLAQKNGFYTGEKNRDYLLGYFLGWGGIADVALQLKMCTKGEHVWFPLNISSSEYQNICLNKGSECFGINCCNKSS